MTSNEELKSSIIRVFDIHKSNNFSVSIEDIFRLFGQKYPKFDIRNTLKEMNIDQDRKWFIEILD